MGLKDSLIRLAGAVVSDMLRPPSQTKKSSRSTSSRSKASTAAARPSAHSRSTAEPTPSAPRAATPKQSEESATGTGPTLTVRARSRFPGPGDIPMVYDVSALGLPTFTYAPREDDKPDPGEIVWTWVPYEEDRSQGKDRPVLVLAEDSGRLIFAQLTSKDNVQPGVRQDRHGNSWLDIGSGPWDSRGRPSEVRLDRLLCVHPSQVRREGARLNATRFTEVVGAITEVYR